MTSAKHPPITLDALPMSEISQWLSDNMLPDARTFLLPGTVQASLIPGNGESAFVQLAAENQVKLAVGFEPLVFTGSDVVSVTVNTGLPATWTKWYPFATLSGGVGDQVGWAYEAVDGAGASQVTFHATTPTDSVITESLAFVWMVIGTP